VILTGHHDQAGVTTHQTAGQEIERGLRSRLRYQIEVFLSVISTEKHIHPAHASPFTSTIAAVFPTMFTALFRTRSRLSGLFLPYPFALILPQLPPVASCLMPAFNRLERLERFERLEQLEPTAS